MRKIFYKNKFVGGFTLLYASLIGALVLTIGLAILNVTVKQITLASAAKQSQYAFYAADTGMECAMYLDNGGGNASCSAGFFPYTGRTTFCQGTFKCNGEDVTTGTIDTNSRYGGKGAVKSQIKVHTGNVCFDITFYKIKDGTNHIESNGYNNCNFANATGEVNRFERQINSDF